MQNLKPKPPEIQPHPTTTRELLADRNRIQRRQRRLARPLQRFEPKQSHRKPHPNAPRKEKQSHLSHLKPNQNAPRKTTEKSQQTSPSPDRALASRIRSGAAAGHIANSKCVIGNCLVPFFWGAAAQRGVMDGGGREEKEQVGKPRLNGGGMGWGTGTAV